MAMVVPEKDHVDALKRTYELIGPIYDVVFDQNGKVLSGSHRLATKLPWPTHTKEVKSELEALLYRLLSNVQRQPGEEEIKYLLNRIAEEVSKEKQIQPSEVCAELTKMFSPAIYTERRIQQLLDSKWKAKTIAKKGETVSPSDGSEETNNKDSEVDIGERAAEAVEDAEKEAHETKTLADDLSKRADDSPAYPFPDCKCSTCSHKEDCGY